MALDFLGTLGGALQGIGAAGSGVAGIASMFGMGKPKIPAEASEALRIQSSLMRGLTGGNSPEFNNMVGAEADQSRKRLLEAINEIVRQNRRAMTRGRAGVVMNPDRRDETIAKALMGVYENEGDRARAAAKQTAMGILGQAPAVANAQMGMANQQYANRQIGPANIIAGLRGIGETGRDISALGAGAPSTTINSKKKPNYDWAGGGIY